ncbi:tyrosine-protein kinase SRK2-like [Gigantopelta aegis]|uniref:tyrosine-protein kinase SRK2-like n=1 Tax=Gigantopelta aegis TaxID=1735272 RepID=UPI001B88DB4D|nr:tyrosine-protein kinase SRK2-like [Gigantopelta aegis]
MGKRLSKRKKPTPQLPNADEVNTPRPSIDNNALSKNRVLPPVPEDPVISSGRTRYFAQYDFDAINDDDLSFVKGDKLEIEDSCIEEGDWWTATNVRTGKTGFVPCNYICKDDNSPEAQEWWWNVDRSETMKQLMLPGTEFGVFIVRPSADLKSYALSVRFEDSATKDPCIRHYKIKQLDNGGFYISPKRQFTDMVTLVEHYQQNGDGLCCKLRKACPKTAPLVHFRDLEVERHKVELSVKLGHGCFGEVFKGRLHNSLDVAIKTLKPGTMTPDAFLSEAKIMHKLRHPKLVQLMAVCSDSEPIYIITELMTNGALLDYLRKEDNRKTITFPRITDMACQIADGMVFLESHNFVHRDLRAANVLVGSRMEVKVADFGLSRILEDDDIYEAHENTKFPIKWTSPEAALNRKFSVKSDVWSFGILLYELVTLGATPYPGMTGHEVLTKVETNYRMPKPRGTLECKDWYYETMLKCWKKTPEDRPTFEHLFNMFNDMTEQEPVGYVEGEKY